MFIIVRMVFVVSVVVITCLHCPSSVKADIVTTAIPYIWTAGIDGKVKVRGIEADVDTGFSDIVDNLDMAFMLHFEAREDKIAFYINPVFLRLVEDASIGPVDARIETQLEIIELGLSYRFLDWSYGTGTGRRLHVDVYGGGRYVFLGSEIDAEIEVADLSADVEEDETWFDPVIGLHLRTDITRKLQFAAKGDIGGFNFADSSDFAWSLFAGLGYRLFGESGIWAGYKVLDIDYETGLSESNSFAYDIRTSGPVIGFLIRF